MAISGVPTAGELGAVLNQIPEPALLVGAGLLAVGYYAYTNVDRRAFKSFEKKPLDEKVTEDLKFRLKKLGKNTEKDLMKDMDKISGIKYYDTYKMRGDTLITPDMDANKPDEDDFDEVMIFMSAPSTDGIMGKLSYGKWLVASYLTDENDPNIYIVDADSVTKTRHQFVLDEDIQFLPTSYAGVMVQNTQSATNVVQQIATVDAQGELTNSMSEFLSKVEHFEIEHLKKMNEMEKEGEIERARQEGLID